MTDPTARETLVNRLFRIPPTVMAVVLIVLIVAGLAFGGWFGAVLLAVGVVAMVGMLGLMWPDLQPVERMMRVAVIVFVACAGVVRVASSI